VITIRPQDSQLVASSVTQGSTALSTKLQNVRLSGFTLRLVRADDAIAQESTVDGIVVDGVETGALTHLAIEAGTRQPLVMKQTGHVRVEYVADGRPVPSIEDERPNSPQLEAEARANRESML